VRYAIAAYVAALVILFVLEIALALAGVPLEIADGALLFELAFLLTLVPLWRSGRLGISDLGLRPVPGARSTALVFVGLLAYGWFSVFWTSGLNLPHATSNFSGISHQSLGAIVVAGFVASVGAPVAEEVFFRGFLYRSLRNRLSILPACLLSATMFGLLHTQYPLAVRPILVFFGVITCLLYERTGSLLPGIALHCIVDAGGFESALTGNESVVWTLFVLLAVVLLARPPLRALSRRLAGKPAFRDFSRAGQDANQRPHGVDDASPHNPFALPDDDHWRPGAPARIAGLLACLALALVALLDTRTDMFSTRSTRASAFTAARPARDTWCEDSTKARLTLVNLAGIEKLRADVRALIDSVPGRTYEAGTITPQAMWSDSSPQRLELTMQAGGIWPASYEIRRFARDGDDIVADVFALSSPARADRFLVQASRARCHLHGRSSTAPDPPRTRNLIWVNPDRFTQQDAFLARGKLVYRVADVRASRSGASPAAEQREALDTVDRLACLLADAGCVRARRAGAPL
jgi:membrane protease YdiL (CAAX protease family)